MEIDGNIGTQPDLCDKQSRTYLLSIDPEADGSVPEASIGRMQQIGEWMATNSEAIYGTEANPLKSTPWGRCTQKRIGKNHTRLYLHVFDFPEDGILKIENENMKVKKAYYLAGKEKIKFEQNADGLQLALHPEKETKHATVVVLDVRIWGCEDVRM